MGCSFTCSFIKKKNGGSRPKFGPGMQLQYIYIYTHLFSLIEVNPWPKFFEPLDDKTVWHLMHEGPLDLNDCIHSNLLGPIVSSSTKPEPSFCTTPKKRPGTSSLA